MTELRRKIDLTCKDDLDKPKPAFSMSNSNMLFGNKHLNQKINVSNEYAWDENIKIDAISHSEKLIKIASSETSDYQNQWSRAHTKIDDPFLQNNDNSSLSKNRKIKQDLQPGVAQATGLENEIVKLIERRLAEDNINFDDQEDSDHSSLSNVSSIMNLILL